MKKLIIIFALMFAACGGDGYSPGEVVNQCRVPHSKVAISCKQRQQTPNGATVSSETGVSQEVLLEIDAGLARAFQNAQAGGYTQRLDYGFYEIFIPNRPCQPSREQRIPSFIVENCGSYDGYDGTVYDLINTRGAETDAARIALGFVHKQDGKCELTAAEQVLNVGTTFNMRGQMIVCPAIAAEGVNNGAEHILAANNPDPNRPDDPFWYYYDTLTHTVSGHPFLPQPSSSSLNRAGEKRAQPSGAMETVPAR